jgi:hypothetical protein
MKRDVLWLILLFAVAVAIVDPRGNFPLDDDWDFAAETSQFARTGHFVFTPFTAASLYAQILWGAGWIKAFGDSYTVLRCSTLVLAALTLILFHALCGLVGLSRWQRSAATAALLFHPIFFWSSFTYMTHVPFLFCTVAAMYCYLRGTPLLGSVAVVVSVLIRQTGIVTAIPAILMARTRRERLIAAAPLVVFAAMFPALQHGEFSFHAQPGRAPFQGALYLFDHFSAVALFALPLLIPAIRVLRGRTIVAASMSLFIARALLFIGFANPTWNPILTSTHLFGNVFINLGLGPPTLVDTHLLGYLFPLHLLDGARVILTMLAAAAGGVLVALLIEKRERSFGYLQVICASAVLAVSQLWFDRYALDAAWPILFLLLVWGSAAPDSPRWRAGVLVLLAAFALIDVVAVREYMQWNRDRNRAWQALLAGGVSPLRINGGVELNAIARDPFEQPRPEWMISNEYVLSFHALPDYDVVRRFGRVYALRRQRAATSPPLTIKWR